MTTDKDYLNFSIFAKELDEEMRTFAKYMTGRATATAEGPSVRRYMVMLTALSRGMALLEYMLEEEGMSKAAIGAALGAMKNSNERTRQELEGLKRDMEMKDIESWK